MVLKCHDMCYLKTIGDEHLTDKLDEKEIKEYNTCLKMFMQLPEINT